MKFDEIPPHITEKLVMLGDPTPLWHLDYWDGPLSGIILLNDDKTRLYYARPTYPDFRESWVVWELTPEEQLHELRAHTEFVRWVGSGTTYHVLNGRRSVGKTHPQEQWHNFYENPEWRKPRHYDVRDILGWVNNPFWG